MKLLDRLRESFAKSLSVPEGQAAPVAIVWTDATGEWLSLAPILRTIMPEFYTFGEYMPEERTGPAIWLKCIVDRTLPDAPPIGKTPVIYLPYVSRQTLRAAADCPPQLAPLIELQYRGRVWHQQNGRDWTVTGIPDVGRRARLGDCARPAHRRSHRPRIASVGRRGYEDLRGEAIGCRRLRPSLCRRSDT